jgi:sensor c-di-GMP phosphodiesterase-like protein
MNKRDIDDQLKDLDFDMDDEIDARNERQGYRPVQARRAHPPMDTSHAIILAAIIIVGGLWGGKLVYDYIQEQRIKAALNEAASYMERSFREAALQSKQAQAEMQQRIAAEARLRQQSEAQAQANQHAEIERIRQEKRFSSDACKFWRAQYRVNPSERNAQKKKEACG